MTELTAERLRELLHYDPETGAITWKALSSKSSRVKVGSEAGCVNKHGYRMIEINRRSYPAHRIAWVILHGEWPSGQIDHINGVRDANMEKNLRDVSPSVNKQNVRGPRKDSKHGFLGATRTRTRWQAVITVDGERKHLGMFATGEEASGAYLSAKRQLHAGCTI